MGALTAPASAGWLVETYGYGALAGPVAGWLLLGLIFFLPVKSSLFQGAPAPRGHALRPTHRTPWVVGLLCLVPFYWVYWFYRAHGEVTALAPSRAILSPRAAVLAGLFVTLLNPVMLASLVDALNKGAVEHGRPALRRPWVVVLWWVLFAPVAFALVQSSMNRAMGEVEPIEAS
jgi:dipeptide/tripeptide permease